MKKTTSELLGRSLNNSVMHQPETIDDTPMHTRKQSEVIIREKRDWSTLDHGERPSSELLFDPSRDGFSENQVSYPEEDPSAYNYDS